jgi:hypothetical protein
LQGYLVNWDVQRKVWDHLFGKEMFKVLLIQCVVINDFPQLAESQMLCK